MADPKLLMISGSLREGSFNRMLLKEAANAFGPAEITTADINLPLYNGDVEEGQGIPDGVKTLAEQLRQADGLVIATPEYNKGISGVLKNALDWLSRVDFAAFQHKPTVVMAAAAGRGGGEVSLFMTLHCLSQFQVRLIMGAPIMVAAAYQQFDENGALKEATYRDALTSRMAELRAAIG